MEGNNGKSFVTNQYALVTYGKSEKEWPFIACSNAKFTEVCGYSSSSENWVNRADLDSL